MASGPSKPSIIDCRALQCNVAAFYASTAPASASVTITTIGSDYDTLLGVYTGTAVSSLTPIVKNDDIDTLGGILQSSVTFSATAGTNYKIAVDGYDADTGNMEPERLSGIGCGHPVYSNQLVG